MTDEFYFSAQDHQITQHTESAAAACPSLFALIDRMGALQRMLHRRLFASGSPLEPAWTRPGVNVGFSYSTPLQTEGLSFAFVRPRAEALAVERMMGRAGVSVTQDPARHPVLEVRLTASHLVAEVIVSPLARWDQRNLSGKLRIARHREGLRALLCEGQGELLLGFWHGTELNDSHVTCAELVRGQVLAEWFDTFSAEHEWVRMGFWIQAGDDRLARRHIDSDISARVVLLAKMMRFFSWSNDNDFHHFHSDNRASARGAALVM